MIDFKFLNDNCPTEWEYATWTFVNVENLEQYRYDIMEDNHFGIRSFLNNFPTNMVVSIISITGPNGVVHTIDNEGIGWGFNITSDLINVVWVRFRDE